MADKLDQDDTGIHDGYISHVAGCKLERLHSGPCRTEHVEGCVLHVGHLGMCHGDFTVITNMKGDVVDVINHPPHYKAYKGLEVIELTEQMNFNRGNAVKYICRAGLKSAETEIEDLEKANWYISREIERLRNDAK